LQCEQVGLGDVIEVDVRVAVQAGAAVTTDPVAHGRAQQHRQLFAAAVTVDHRRPQHDGPNPVGGRTEDFLVDGVTPGQRRYRRVPVVLGVDDLVQLSAGQIGVDPGAACSDVGLAGAGQGGEQCGC